MRAVQMTLALFASRPVGDLAENSCIIKLLEEKVYDGTLAMELQYATEFVGCYCCVNDILEPMVIKCGQNQGRRHGERTPNSMSVSATISMCGKGIL